MRKKKCGLLAGVAAVVMLSMVACGNNANENGTTETTKNNTTAATTSTTATTPAATNGGTGATNNGGIFEDIGDGIQNGVDELATDIGIDGNNKGTANDAGASDGAGMAR